MENSKIEWTHHTFNPWWGCMKVSEGCKNCYAETLDRRLGAGQHWGPSSERKPMAEKYWNQPERWNRAAAAAGRRDRVFCASMADVFEDHPQVVDIRRRLFRLILGTPSLDWLLLTKRPENINRLIPELFHAEFPPNIWLGTSVENQENLITRVPHLIQAPGAIKFLSCEPLLGSLNFSSAINVEGIDFRKISWIIVGGESGKEARPMHPDWASHIRNVCITLGMPFFFKQWGEYLPACQLTDDQVHGPRYWPEVKFPSPHNPNKVNTYYRAGKKEAGCLLDGIEYKEYPLSQPV